MDDDGSPQGGRDGNWSARRRPRWGRRSPYGLYRDGPHGEHDRASYGDRRQATYAALDLGTNNCRLLIARPTSDGFRVVDAFSRIVRLGEGLAANCRIGDAAIARAVDALLGVPRQDARAASGPGATDRD